MWPRTFDPRRAATDAVASARRAVGGRLVGATLYGSAVTPDFHPAHSDVNVAFLFEALGVEELEALRGAQREWARHRVANPLLLTRQGMMRSVDTFALEYLLIRERHQTLHGDDLFAGLSIDPAALRLGVERALRVQELGLASAYVALAGTRSGARYWAARASTELAASASGLLYLAGETLPARRAELAERCAARFGVDAEAMRGLLNARSVRRPRMEGSQLLASALAIMNRLLDAADRIAVSTATS
jgi:hypothetical protein